MTVLLLIASVQRCSLRSSRFTALFSHLILNYDECYSNDIERDCIDNDCDYNDNERYSHDNERDSNDNECGQTVSPLNETKAPLGRK